ncbi:transcriptional regulator [Kitasatospora sp. NPDC052896]|uniref:transcriptional regulator n=1 Tax=Kitasatospora sp. NPDC052896 TaxID=3364061 RepID=UPI0037C5BA24
MLTTVSGTPACPDADRQHRLAAQLADMIPGAATIRVSFTDPTQRWPHAHSRAWDAAGEPIELSRTTAKIAARWILRVWPEADWSLAHTLSIASATLTHSTARAASSRGR